ncbi:MAG TPA: nucleotidyltransferase family protein [Dehalococcoidia bacterium]|nr:nucleotidyltransferase family protein [Dehalococcoidia bacterium]
MYALIIAGGEGERLRPLTNDRPKNMVAVAGRPIVERQIEWLRAGGVTDVVFLCGYRHEVLEAHVGDGSSFGVRAQYSIESEPLGRGGALKQGFTAVPDGEALVIACNGDILTDQPPAELVAFHKGREATATIMLTPLKSSYGIVDVEDNGRVTSFREKPLLPYWINAGIYVFSRDIVSLLPDKGDHETETFPQLTESGKLSGFRSEAYWRPVDSIKDLSEAEKELAAAGG